MHVEKWRERGCVCREIRDREREYVCGEIERECVRRQIERQCVYRQREGVCM